MSLDGLVGLQTVSTIAKWLAGKTRLRSDLLCVECDVKLHSLNSKRASIVLGKTLVLFVVQNHFIRHNTPHPKELRTRHARMLAKTVGVTSQKPDDFREVCVDLTAPFFTVIFAIYWILNQKKLFIPHFKRWSSQLLQPLLIGWLMFPWLIKIWLKF